MGQRIKFYCDESGNTGVNYVDEKNPFFILGGWLDIDNKGSDSKFIMKLKKLLELNEECKAKKLHKSVNGRRKMKEIINLFQENNFYPILSIIDKRFATAARINSILLDHEYNDLADSRIERDEYDIPLYELAEIMDKLSDKTLEMFAFAYRNCDSDNMIKCINAISKELSILGYKEIGRIVKNSSVKIESNLKAEATNPKEQAPNIFALNCLLRLINDICNIEEAYEVDFIHDEQLQYGENMNSMVSILAQDRNDKIRFAYKDEGVFYKSIKSFSFAKSDDVLLLQCADILVGSINYILKALLANEEMDISKKELFEQIQPYLYGQYCKTPLTFFMISKERFNNLLPNSQEILNFIRTEYYN